MSVVPVEPARWTVLCLNPLSGVLQLRVLK
jgi:hypothetical protein